NRSRMARFAGEDRFPGLDAEEDQFLHQTVSRVILSWFGHPFLAANTLMQLGHEPFPLNTVIVKSGKKRINVYYYLPNTLSYAKQLAQSHSLGWSVLLTGFDAASLAFIAKRYSIRWTTKYLNAHFPDFGGMAENLEDEERMLTDAQSFR
ncbi:hypothetical protein PMAYCL1PPCAC_05361, partial [Pristionchus mayeri]